MQEVGSEEECVGLLGFGDRCAVGLEKIHVDEFRTFRRGFDHQTSHKQCSCWFFPRVLTLHFSAVFLQVRKCSQLFSLPKHPKAILSNFCDFPAVRCTLDIFTILLTY